MTHQDDQRRFGMPRGPSRGNPGRWSVLDLLRRVRAGRSPGPNQVEAMGLELRIPELDYAVLVRRFPDLQSPDHEIKLRAWQRFLRSSLSDPYRVHARSLKRLPNRSQQRATDADNRDSGVQRQLPVSSGGTVE